jgi:hypothetical protein
MSKEEAEWKEKSVPRRVKISKEKLLEHGDRRKVPGMSSGDVRGQRSQTAF